MEVAELMDCSKSTVRRLEASELHPQIGPHGERLFAEEDVRAVVISRRRTIRADRDGGDVAAEVFKALNAGTSARDVVIELRLDPKRVRSLRADWADLDGGVFISPEGLSKLMVMLCPHEPADAPQSEAGVLAAVQRTLAVDERIRSTLVEQLDQAREALDRIQRGESFAMNEIARQMIEGIGGSR